MRFREPDVYSILGVTSDPIRRWLATAQLYGIVQPVGASYLADWWCTQLSETVDDNSPAACTALPSTMKATVLVAFSHVYSETCQQKGDQKNEQNEQVESTCECKAMDKASADKAVVIVKEFSTIKKKPHTSHLDNKK